MNRDAALELYIKAINKDITKAALPKPKRHHDNLTVEERKAFSSLKARTDIAIKKADKGLAMHCSNGM